MVNAGDILASLRTRFELTLGGRPGTRLGVGRALAGRRRAHRVDVIASVTRPFCRACDRTRLTADG
ncbi:hypothetical protein [Streptomyces jeddahensis]|uniref:hypothetical protein n=1 Tax=Streptomyces jeddahensis TaxID=1716141 RepID=UPI0038CD1C60